MHAIVQTTFSTLIVVQFLVVTLHDWLNIPGWAHGKQVQVAVGRRKFLLATFANSIFPGLAVAFIFLYRSGPKPSFVTSYWMIYCAVAVFSAVMMWYVPYFFGADEKTKRCTRQCTQGRSKYCRRAETIPVLTCCTCIFTRFFC